MKKHLLKAAALLLALGFVFVGQAKSKRIQARYTIEELPTICNPGGTLPQECGVENTGTICTVNGTTFYQFNSCVYPYYRQD